MSLQRLALASSIVIALAAPGAHAIYLNTDAFRAGGGDPANIAATLDKGLASRVQRSMQAPFDAVGVVPGCTGTWLGNDDRFAWVLTAAHCVGSGWQHFAIYTPTMSASGWSRAYYPPQFAGGIAWDIALVSIPLAMPLSPKWSALTKPTLYDGNAEVGRTVHLVGQGVRGIGQTSVGGGGRVWGTSKIVGAFADNTGLVSAYAASGPTEYQVRAVPGDSGSAAWQQHAGGYWTIIGVVSTGGSNGTNYTRVNRHVDWIKGVFPGATRFSERFTVTDARPFVSRNHAEDVEHGTVYYVLAPGQAHVQGPLSGTWTHALTHSRITVMARDEISGRERPIVLRASKDSSCGGLAMENGNSCYGAKMGPLTVAWHAADNAGLPSGEWKAKFDVEAVGWHRPYRERLPINVDVRNLVQARVQRDKPWVSANFAQAASRGTVYYVVPPQAGATGPTSGIWGGPQRHGTMHVLVREASTGFERRIALRTSRTTGCSTSQMHDGVMCYDFKQGPLTVAYQGTDNADLPAGKWKGVAYIRAKGWHDHAVDEAIRLDVDIDQ